MIIYMYSIENELKKNFSSLYICNMIKIIEIKENDTKMKNKIIEIHMK